MTTTLSERVLRGALVALVRERGRTGQPLNGLGPPSMAPDYFCRQSARKVRGVMPGLTSVLLHLARCCSAQVQCWARAPAMQQCQQHLQPLLVQKPRWIRSGVLGSPARLQRIGDPRSPCQLVLGPGLPHQRPAPELASAIRGAQICSRRKRYPPPAALLPRSRRQPSIRVDQEIAQQNMCRSHPIPMDGQAHPNSGRCHAPES